MQQISEQCHAAMHGVSYSVSQESGVTWGFPSPQLPSDFAESAACIDSISNSVPSGIRSPTQLPLNSTLLVKHYYIFPSGQLVI